MNEEWGVYNVDNDTAKAMMDLLVDNKSEECHSTRNFGFICPLIKHELESLTVYKYLETNIPADKLSIFQAKYPILFDALQANLD